MGQVCGVGRGLRWKIKQNKSKFLALSMLGSKLFDIPSYFTKKRMTKFSAANFHKMFCPSYIILRIQRQKGKQCRSRRGGSLWATSLRSMLFAKSAIFDSGTERVKRAGSKIQGCCFFYRQGAFLFSFFLFFFLFFIYLLFCCISYMAVFLNNTNCPN